MKAGECGKYRGTVIFWAKIGIITKMAGNWSIGKQNLQADVRILHLLGGLQKLKWLSI